MQQHSKENRKEIITIVAKMARHLNEQLFIEREIRYSFAILWLNGAAVAIL